MISVIIPNYNQGYKLISTLDSLDSQTFRSFEVIIVNDGEPLLEPIFGFYKYKLTNITTVNQGVSCARNIGAALSSNELLVFLDSGDIVLKDFLMNMFLLHEKHDTPVATSFKFSVNGSFQINKCKQEQEIERYFDYEEYCEYLFEANYLFVICSLLVNKSDFQIIGGFNTGYTHGEDHEFILRYIKYKGGVYFSTKRDFIYCLDDESSTRNNRVKPIYGHIKFLYSLKYTLVSEKKYYNYLLITYFLNNYKFGILKTIKNIFKYASKINILIALKIIVRKICQT